MSIAAIVFASAVVLAAAFQLALAAGVPWGHLALGGRFSGRLPIPFRFAAVLQAGLLLVLGIGVLAKAGLSVLLESQADFIAWAAVAVSVVSLIMNLATPSEPERRLWAPVGLVMTVSSLVVALG